MIHITYTEIENIMIEITNNPTTLETARKRRGAFTRESPLTFEAMLGIELDMRKTTVQTRLNAFFKEGEKMPVSQQAYSARRALFDHSPFETMAREAVKKEYSGANEMELWKGYHILSVDGSYAQLPPVDALRTEFGIRGGGNRPSAGMSVLYDVLNGWPIDPYIGHTNMNEREQCEKHVEFLCRELGHIAQKTILTIDRGYPSAEMFKYLSESGIKFVARCKSVFLKAINGAPVGDTVVTLNNGVTLRVIKFHLPNGDVVTLATNVFDLPADDFPDLYLLRWGIETFYFRVKRELSLESFTGKTANSVRQDFWASMFIAQAVAIFQRDADTLIHHDQDSKDNKLEYQARTSDIIITMRDNFVFAALSGNPILCQYKLSEIVRTMAKSKSAVRPGRSFPRNFAPFAKAKLNLKSRL